MTHGRWSCDRPGRLAIEGQAQPGGWLCRGLAAVELATCELGDGATCVGREARGGGPVAKLGAGGLEGLDVVRGHLAELVELDDLVREVRLESVVRSSDPLGERGGCQWNHPLSWA